VQEADDDVEGLLAEVEDVNRLPLSLFNA